MSILPIKEKGLIGVAFYCDLCREKIIGRGQASFTFDPRNPTSMFPMVLHKFCDMRIPREYRNPASIPLEALPIFLLSHLEVEIKDAVETARIMAGFGPADDDDSP